MLVSLGLGGPVFALIEQPVYGFGDPRVWVPLVVGPRLPGRVPRGTSTAPTIRCCRCGLFRSRNFAVGNAATLGIYGGLGAATFFVTIFLQQVAGYRAIEAGSSLMPITIVMWLLSRRFGALSDRIGPRLLMGLGPIVAGVGLIWLGRLGAEVDYFTELLPGVLVFAPRPVGDGGAADQHGARRGAPAQRGRGQRRQQPDRARRLAARDRGGRRGGRRAYDAVLEDAGRAPLAREPAVRGQGPAALGRGGRAAGARPAVEDASVSAYRAGVGVAGGLVILGGITSLIGIVNPPRAAGRRREELGAVRLAQPCPDCRQEEPRAA